MRCLSFTVYKICITKGCEKGLYNLRDIKFRAWDKVCKHWIKWTEIKELVLWELMEDDRYDVVEYSGLKDTRGMEIYEGDILRVYEYFQYNHHENYEREIEYISVVEFIESGFLVTEPNDTQVPLACFYYPDLSSSLFELEIVGHIFNEFDMTQKYLINKTIR